jgi:hypothetical protein
VASAELVNAALPLVRVTVASTVVPSLNVADPVGVPEVEGFTVAVNVTAAPCLDGFSDDTTVVEVAALVTTTVSTGDVLPVKFASLLYVAVIECDLTVRFLVVIFAKPLDNV